MKVCIISPYPPAKDGIGIYSGKIARLLRKQNNEIFILSTPFEEIKQEGVFRWISFSVINILKSIQLIRKEKPDIIHVQYAIPAFGIYNLPLLCILFGLRLSGFKNIVATYHEVKRETDFLGIIGKIYYRFFSNLFVRIFIHTREAEKILINICDVSSSKIHVIPHGLYEFRDTHDYQQELKKKYHIANKQVILYLGFIHVDKGIQYLIRAIAHLKETNSALFSNLQVLIVGSVRERKGLFKIFERKDQRYYEYLINLVKESKLTSEIQFIGHIKEKYVYSIFKLAKIVVLPYEKVEQSGVLHVALAAGKPIIASAIGGLGETLKVSGMLVSPGSYKEIASAVNHLMTDEKYYQSFTINYSTLSLKIGNEYMIGSLISAYQSIQKYEK